MRERDYLKLFDGESIDSKDRIVHALNRAHEIRKFEIELYWKRAAYFWVFIASLFAAFGTLFPFDPEKATDLQTGRLVLALYLTGALGFLASMAWYFVNRGSKYWQENWEAHVDALENRIEGPLYKTILDRKSPWNPTGPYPFSVSRTNIAVSLGVAASWLFVLFWLPFFVKHSVFQNRDWCFAIGVPLVLAAIGLLFGRCVKSSLKDRHDARHFSIRNVSVSGVSDPRSTTDDL